MHVPVQHAYCMQGTESQMSVGLLQVSSKVFVPAAGARTTAVAPFIVILVVDGPPNYSFEPLVSSCSVIVMLVSKLCNFVSFFTLLLPSKARSHAT